MYIITITQLLCFVKLYWTVFNTLIHYKDWYTMCIMCCCWQKSMPAGWRKETNAFGVTLYVNVKTNEKVYIYIYI